MLAATVHNTMSGTPAISSISELQTYLVVTISTNSSYQPSPMALSIILTAI
jgi:hypothetical protein